MPNILIVGWEKDEGEQIIDCLLKLVPEDMEHAVYKVFPEAPVYAKSKDPAPYIEIMDDDIDRARRIKDAIQVKIECEDGPPDVQILLIEFYEGNGKITEDDNR